MGSEEEERLRKLLLSRKGGGVAKGDVDREGGRDRGTMGSRGNQGKIMSTISLPSSEELGAESSSGQQLSSQQGHTRHAPRHDPSSPSIPPPPPLPPSHHQRGGGPRHQHGRIRQEEEAPSHHRPRESGGDYHDRRSGRGGEQFLGEQAAAASSRSRPRHVGNGEGGGQNRVEEERGEEEEEEEEEEAEEIRWDALLSEEGQRELEAALFTKDDFIKAGSPAHRDFADFLEKYASFRRRELDAQKTKKRDTEAAAGHEKQQQLSKAAADFVKDLPKKYDQRYRLNFTVLQARGGGAEGQHSGGSRSVLGHPEVAEGRRALLMFEDFRQKKSIGKIRKMREDQRALPIYQFRESIIEAVREHQVVLIAGDTGCGKSTQVPQYLIQAGFTNVACTQPRRISTISLCRRVASETLNEFGSQVAYQIRFDSNRTERTRILFLTEGLLLRQIATDPLLEQYSVIIIDEVHERHLTGDFLLGILLDIVKRRPSLKVVLMSATIQQQLFADYFGAFPIQVPGRLYPITIEYIPPEVKEGEKQQPLPSESRQTVSGLTTSKLPGAKPKPIDTTPYLRLLERIDREYERSQRGDLLVFLSGINEITAVAERMREHAKKTKRWIVLTLHSSVPAEEQDKVFDIAPDGVRKCVLSTNIAETSVTIDGIRFVADSGKVKEMGYDASTGTHSLQEYWVSKASANQRRGRAGRTGPGVCFRLYEQEAFGEFLDFAIPEIKRVQIESTALQIKCMGLGDPRRFPFIEPPPEGNLEHAMQVLRHLQCVSNDVDEEILPLGAVLSQLPVDLPMGKLLVLGTMFGLADELMTIAAAISVQSPFQRVDQGGSEAQLRQGFVSEEGDPFTLLNAYDEWIKVKGARGEDSRKWCRRHGLEEQRLYEITRLKDQFGNLLKDAGLLREETVAQARNRVARSNPDRSWKRQQLRKLQREREQNKKRKVLEMEDAGGGEEVAGGDDAEGEGAGVGGKGEVDLKSLEFELSYDLRTMSDVSTRDLTVQQINVIKFCLASSLYPNVAVADAANVNRKIQDAVFSTFKKREACMHPTSVYGSAPSLVGQSDMLTYSQILETSKPYLMNATKAPFLQTLLLVCSSIDVGRSCTCVLIDDWLEVNFKGGQAAERAIYVTQRLRMMLTSCLASRLSSSAPPRSGNSSSAPPPGSVPTLLEQLLDEDRGGGGEEGELASKVAELMESDLKYTVRVPSRSHVLWKLLHPSVRGLGSSAQAIRDAQEDAATVSLPDGGIDSNALRSLKGGVHIATSGGGGLRYGSLFEGPVLGGGFQSSLGHHSTCSKCRQSFLATLEEIVEHEEKCAGPSSPPPQASAPEDRVDAPQLSWPCGGGPGGGGGGGQNVEGSAREVAGGVGGGGRGDGPNGGQRDAMVGDGGSDSKTMSKNSVLLQFVPPAQVSAGRDASGAVGRGSAVVGAEHPIVASCMQAGALPLHIEGVQDLEGLGAEVLKGLCSVLGLKVGGTALQRAQRLASTIGKARDEWDAGVLADASGGVGGARKKAKKQS